MRYRSYLTAACLAFALPMQANAQAAEPDAISLMRQIGNSPNMRLWDRLIVREAKRAEKYDRQRWARLVAEDPKIAENNKNWRPWDYHRNADQHFIQHRQPLGNIFTIPTENIESIKIYVINIDASVDGYTDRITLDEVKEKEYPSDLNATPNYYHFRRAFKSYDVPDEKIAATIGIIKQIQAQHAVLSDADPVEHYNYRLLVDIAYRDGQLIRLGTRRRWQGNHANGVAIGLDKQPVYLDFDFRDINILFQYLDKEMIVFADDIFLKQWERGKE